MPITLDSATALACALVRLPSVNPDGDLGTGATGEGEEAEAADDEQNGLTAALADLRPQRVAQGVFQMAPPGVTLRRPGGDQLYGL